MVTEGFGRRCARGRCELRKAGTRDKAMAILGCLVGTVLIARSVDDPELSKAMRKAARQFLRDAMLAAQLAAIRKLRKR